MIRSEIINQILEQKDNLGLTILKSDRFKKMPLKAAFFYSSVAKNRYTPFLTPIKAKTLWGHTLKAYETSAIGSVYFLGFYDTDVSLFLLKYFKESGDLLDVGSNIGYYTSLFTQIAKPESRIVAFEPTPSTFSILNENVSNLPQVETIQIALSDKNGEISFFDYGHRHGVFNSSKAQPLDFLKDAGNVISVKTETLDSWCQNNTIKPSLLKLDTEGTEASILRCSKSVLSNYQPIILLEVGGGEAWKDNARECFEILASHKYSFFELTNEGDLVPHVQQETYSYKNLVCIPESKINNYVTTR